MKKKEYKQPTMKIAQMKQRNHLLAGSDLSLSASRRGYDSTEEQNWE